MHGCGVAGGASGGVWIAPGEACEQLPQIELRVTGGFSALSGLQDQMGLEALSQISQQVNDWAWKQPLVLVHVTAGD